MLYYKTCVRRKPGTTERTEVLKQSQMGLNLSNAMCQLCILGTLLWTSVHFLIKIGATMSTFQGGCVDQRFKKKETEKQKNKNPPHPAHNTCSINSACSSVCAGCCHENTEKLWVFLWQFPFIPTMSRHLLSTVVLIFNLSTSPSHIPGTVDWWSF